MCWGWRLCVCAGLRSSTYRVEGLWFRVQRFRFRVEGCSESVLHWLLASLGCRIEFEFWTSVASRSKNPKCKLYLDLEFWEKQAHPRPECVSLLGLS